MQAAFSSILWVGFGGFLGAILRYGISEMLTRFGKPSSFPWGTFLINTAGCLLIGLLAGWLEKQPDASPIIRLFWMVGLCGGFTTFSAFSLENLQLMQSGQWGLAILYALLSVLLCIAACAMGVSIMKS